jgi:hypothetical protein
MRTFLKSFDTKDDNRVATPWKCPLSDSMKMSPWAGGGDSRCLLQNGDIEDES